MKFTSYFSGVVEKLNNKILRKNNSKYSNEYDDNQYDNNQEKSRNSVKNGSNQMNKNKQENSILRFTIHLNIHLFRAAAAQFAGAAKHQTRLGFDTRGMGHTPW